MAYHGDISLGDTIDFQFNTFRFSTGAPFTLAGTPTLAAYVGNSTTEITAGLTLTVDFDAKTGLHNVRVVATSGNGYATGTDVTVVLAAGTVDSVSVANAVVGSFSIEKRSALRPTTAGRTLDVTATGAAGIDWANVESPTTAVNLSGTNIKTDQVVASVSGAVGSVTGAVGSVTGAVGSVTALAANSLTASALATDAVNEIADGVRARQLTESYAADGVAPTLEQALLLIQQMLTEMSIAGTTMTIKKLDGTTTAATLTLNDATTPTSVTRAT